MQDSDPKFEVVLISTPKPKKHAIATIRTIDRRMHTRKPGSSYCAESAIGTCVRALLTSEPSGYFK